MLSLKSVTAGYGETVVLRDVTFTVNPGEVVALLGPNGAGKSTLLRTATGFVKPRSGSVEFEGKNVSGERPYSFSRRGVCMLPEGRGIFPSLTVLENLRIQARAIAMKQVLDEVGEMFPVLCERLGQTAGSLSGGEQQMLALCRAYITNPKVVLVDEASLGLAPLVTDKIYAVLAQLVARGLSAVIVEQYVQRALDLAQTVYILNRGEIAHVGPTNKIDADQIYAKYLGVE